MPVTIRPASVWMHGMFADLAFLETLAATTRRVELAHIVGLAAEF